MQRLPYDASTEAEVRQYFITRALQMSSKNIVWLGDMSQPVEGCFLTHFFDLKTEQRYLSFYITKQHRGTGKAVRAVKYASYPIITVNDCNIVNFLIDLNANFRVVQGTFDSQAYELIQKEYGDKRAKRSQVFLMNHIDEGLYILEMIGASEAAKNAYCLHPLVQTDEDLAKNLTHITNEWNCDRYEVALALEYRNIANQWLSDKVITDHNDVLLALGKPTLSPLKDVNMMLIADKIQNYKDFIIYHKGIHPRSEQLDKYFLMWLEALGVDNFQDWFNNMRDIVPSRFNN